MDISGCNKIRFRIFKEFSRLILHDSTFMGILTMISRLCTMKSCPVILSNVNEANKKNFKSLGISQILNFTDTSTQQMPIMEALPTGGLSEKEKHKNKKSQLYIP